MYFKEMHYQRRTQRWEKTNNLKIKRNFVCLSKHKKKIFKV